VPEQLALGYAGLLRARIEEAPQRKVYFAWSRNPTPAAAAFQALVLGADEAQGN